MKLTFLAPLILASLLPLGAYAAGTPSIKFEQTVYDFGATSQVATVTGVFKFKNTGDGVLKLEAPKPSCGCTLAEFKSDTLQPGETGELPFTLHLGLVRAQLEKHIAVKSNDPLTPEVSLTIKADYTPLYELNPMTLAPSLAFGVNATEQFTLLTRTDGRAPGIARLEPSKPWITAKIEPAIATNPGLARIRVSVEREGAPRRFNEFIHIYAEGQTNTPVASIYVYGQMLGAVALDPEALYWSIPDTTNAPAERPEALVLRRITIRSADGKPLALKNAQSSVKGIKVELVPKEEGQAYELVARLEDLPASTLSGNVSFETSVASQPRIEVPVIVNVFKP